jgi:hypothetical protein
VACYSSWKPSISSPAAKVSCRRGAVGAVAFRSLNVVDHAGDWCLKLQEPRSGRFKSLFGPCCQLFLLVRSVAPTDNCSALPSVANEGLAVLLQAPCWRVDQSSPARALLHSVIAKQLLPAPACGRRSSPSNGAGPGTEQAQVCFGLSP